MPSKLRKALGAVKDQTSISLAKVTNAANLEVVILKATTHDEIPMDERYVNEIVHLVSSNKVYAAACAQYIGKRIGKTKNWVVVLKSLMIVLTIFQDGDPYFPREVFHAMKRGAKILNLATFRDDSNSSPWDYSAFVRTIALYLDERLDCFLTGKLQRRVTLMKNHQKNKKMFNDTTGIKEMKPAMLLDRITYWQRLLDRAMGTKPTGPAKTNRLVQISLYAIVQESFDLYRDISDGLVVILDNFFKLPCKACISAFQACVRSSKQFDELSSFYSSCLAIGVGRAGEYPKVQKISQELMEALQEFLRDQAANNENENYGNDNGQSPLSKHLLVSALRESVVGSSGNYDEASEQYGTPERYYETASEYAASSHFLVETASTTPGKASHNNDFPNGLFGQSLVPQNQYNPFLELEDIPTVSPPTATIDQNQPNFIDFFEAPTSFHAHQESSEATTSMAPPTTFNAQNSSSSTDLDLIFGDFNSKNSCTAATPPTFRAQESMENNISLVPTFQARNQDEMPTRPTLSSQGSFKICSTPTLSSQGSFKISLPSPSYQGHKSSQKSLAPTLNSLSSFKISLPSPSYQGHNSSQKSPAPTLNSLGSFKISSPSPSYQGHNSSQKSPTPTLNSLGSFKINSPSSSYQGHNSSQKSLAPTLNSLGSFKISSPSPSYQGHNSSQKSLAPTLNSQGSFKISSPPSSSYQGQNLSQRSLAPTLNSQGSFKIISPSPPSSYQGQNTSQKSSAPTLNSQGSFKINSASNFHDQNSYETNSAPTFNSQGSFKLSTTSTFSSSHSSYQNSTTPTFDSQGLVKFSSTSTFEDHNSYHISATPTFRGHHNAYQTSTTSTFQGHSSYNMASIAPTYPTSTGQQIFQGHNSSYERSIEPTFCSPNSYQISPNPAFQQHYGSFQTSTTTPIVRGQNSYQTCVAPSFQGHHNMFQTSMEPSFHAHSSHQTSMAPTFRAYNNSYHQASPTPTFRSEIHTNEATSFWGENFHDATVAPTFRAKLPNETIMVGEAKLEDDLFGPWPSAALNSSNENALNKAMQEQSLLRQQQTWLEQQNKIIAKHMT
ncbi:clathrin coat assembly protein AP180 [Senna tora]|uniref:Clathrin coat assembly protein AP180 n=1 Tax=Senna tora TaxID=362788 RepID=A0A834T4V3_9FABA|nr:clathrin coat assembly protein AP180 [Senna tora]